MYLFFQFVIKFHFVYSSSYFNDEVTNKTTVSALDGIRPDNAVVESCDAFNSFLK